MLVVVACRFGLEESHWSISHDQPANWELDGADLIHFVRTLIALPIYYNERGVADHASG